MAEESDLYQGREHSKIKHLFLADYLKAASFKVLQGPNPAKTFTYVDGFAGPWSVSDEEDCSDSSFDYAVRVLLDTQATLRNAGKTVPRLRFLLCERDPEAFKRLSAYAQKKVGIEIRVFSGCFEDNLDAIRGACEGFTFSFIDPKGWNLRSAEIAEFLARVRGDFLLNFMEHPISRHSSFPAVNASFGRFIDDPYWADKIITGADAPSREMQILQLLKSRLKAHHAAKYMPDFAILKPKADRVQMRLVLGTHHAQGVEVFRTVEKKAQTIQVEIRRGLSEGSGSSLPLFSTETLNDIELAGSGVGGDKSRRLAIATCREVIAKIDHAVRFDDLAAKVMETASVRMTDMKDVLIQLRNDGALSFDLTGRSKKPSEETLVRRGRS